MSFRDLESGLPPQRQPLYLMKSKSNSNYYERNKEEADEEVSRLVAAGIFQLQTAVASFYRLVNSLGTPKDTLQLRDNLSVSSFSFFLCSTPPLVFSKNELLAGTRQGRVLGSW